MGQSRELKRSPKSFLTQHQTGIIRTKSPDPNLLANLLLEFASRQKYAAFVQDAIRQGFVTPWEDLLAQTVLGDRNFLERLKGMKNAVIKGGAKDQPSYRRIQSVEAEALIKQAADYFRVGEADLIRKRGQHRQERALVMELLRTERTGSNLDLST